MTTMVSIYEAKTHLSRLLDQVQAGERVITAKAGKPIAEFPELIGHDSFGSLLAQAKVAQPDFLTAGRRLLAHDFDWIFDAAR